MKITMEFNLPDEQYDFDNARNGDAYYAALNELYDWLRRQYKYDAGEISGDAALAVKDVMFALLDEHEVSI